MAYKKISELTTKGQTWSIKAKILRMWDSVNFATDEIMSFDMLLMDEEGETIHATIWKNLIDNFRPMISENSIYAFSNFKVQESTKYCPVDKDLKITFMYNTKVKEMKGASNKFKEYYFEFATRETLVDRVNKDKILSDVIGLLTKIKPIESRMIMKNSTNPRPKDIREIELLLLDGAKIRVTLWGQLAHSLNEDVIGNHTVVVVTSTTVQEFNGLSLRSSSATRLYTDINIPETWKIISRHSDEQNLPKLMEVDKSTQGTLEEQMFYNRKTLQEITNMGHDDTKSQDFICTTKATIDHLQDVTWWYMSCNDCNKKVVKKIDKYYCEKCKMYPENTKPRMLNTSISSLLNSLDGRCEEVPTIIQQLCGRTFIFQLKLNIENLTQGKSNYIVRRTFVPDDKLEMQHLDDKVKDLLNNEKDKLNYPPNRRESSLYVHIKQEPEDSDGDKDETTSSRKIQRGSQTTKEYITIEDDTGEENDSEEDLEDDSEEGLEDGSEEDIKEDCTKTSVLQRPQPEPVATISKRIGKRLTRNLGEKKTSVYRKQETDAQLEDSDGTKSAKKRGKKLSTKIGEIKASTPGKQQLADAQLEDSDEPILKQGIKLSTNEKRRRSFVIEDESEDECTTKNYIKRIELQVGKSGLDNKCSEQRSVATTARRGRKRSAKEVDDIKTNNTDLKHQIPTIPNGQIEDEPSKTRPKRTRKMNPKYN
ncbi:hypothetical protein OsI_28022 [Oryza sativa Indica Group]|uniref:Replication factor A C-terminal domain-containing protein n=1 Tax=Oryza sativa subsp. indica TaxID=39946 RepID=B8BB79_ORYSI|nr:hypothetical protein OsI_28022 [Oryza sativa Indica Group]